MCLKNRLDVNTDGEQDLHKLGDDLDKLFDKTEQTDLRPRNCVKLN